MTRENCVGREPLSRDRICEAALDAIDSDGLDCLSMRALADALGVKASSLYYHFSCKEELLTGVAEFLYRRLGRPPEDGEWDDQVKGTFLQLHDFVRSHPNAAPLLLRDLAYSPVAKKRAGVLMKLLGRAGLDPELGATLVGNLVALLVGHTLLDIWVQQDGVAGESDEASNRGDLVGGFGVQSARPWVQKVLDGGGYGVTSGRFSESNAGFLAGLDALIKGFAGN